MNPQGVLPSIDSHLGTLVYYHPANLLEVVHVAPKVTPE